MEHRFLLQILFPVILLLVGTGGYCLIEGWTVFDSLYMTVITVTTVGYGEVRQLSTLGRSFTMVLCLGGVFTLYYTITETIRTVVSGEVQGILGRHRMEQRLRTLKDHMIVCGFGRMGRLVCREFESSGVPYVVIERDPDNHLEEPARHGLLLHGEATSDEMLMRAGIERAKALVAVIGSDADNLYITMSARLLNDRLMIVARAEEARSEAKLMRAGATHVVMPVVIGGNRVAQAVLRPTVVDFLTLATRTEHFALQIEEVQIAGGSPFDGTSLRDSKLRQDFEVVIVAIKRAGGRMLFNPPSQTVILGGDTLVAIGDRVHLDRLTAAATRGSTGNPPPTAAGDRPQSPPGKSAGENSKK